jgi:hypothetical protein
MRSAVLVTTFLLLLQAGFAMATPLTERDLDEVYRSCVASPPAGTRPDVHQRYCACFRSETERSFTREDLSAVEERLRANALTMADRDRIEAMAGVCNARARETAPPATPAPSTAAPAPQPPSGDGPLTEAELDVERRECLASVARNANVTPEVGERYCGCITGWMRRDLTRATLAGLNQRQRTNTLTMQDRERMEQAFQACIVEARRPATAAPQRPAQVPATPDGRKPPLPN